MKTPLACLLFATALSLAQPALAQTPATPGDAVDVVEDIVVVARRSGAPVWRVVNGDATVIIVGSLNAVPADTPWRPDALEAAVGQADTIILSQSATMSLGDFFRMRRARARLPEGRTPADYLTPEWQARLLSLQRQHRRDYEERGLTWIADDLREARLRYPPGLGRSADAVVRSAARRAGTPVDEVGNMDGHSLDEAVAIPDAAQVECLTAAIAANESGAAGVRARGLAWTRQAVPEVLASPLEKAVDRCGWFADETLIAEGRAQWSKALAEALTLPRTTMVVAPISIVAEAGGLLDQAEARGLEVTGPAWKPE